MPDLRTDITELATGLGMTGAADIPNALASRRGLFTNVSTVQWDRITAAWNDEQYPVQFAQAWDNGRAFLESPDGLRGRIPALIEWKGSHRAPGFDTIPADLRVDHVYLVSCKYQSQILTNSSPVNLFDRRLADRSAGRDPVSWYQQSAPEAYASFYAQVRRHVGQDRLPARPSELADADLALIRRECSRRWPAPLALHWRSFSIAVAEVSAERWRSQLSSPARQEEMVWRLLRLAPAPYYIMGVSRTGEHMRLRIGTPWDWRQQFALEDFTVTAIDRDQPVVAWSALITDMDRDSLRRIDGHVEIRWAHGRFSSVEAKVYLDTPHSQVCGYFPLRLPWSVDPPPRIGER